MPILNGPLCIQMHVDAIRRFRDESKLRTVTIGLSGGIDSAVVAGLCVAAYGPENVILIHSTVDTSPDQTQRARRLSEALGVPLVKVALENAFDSMMITGLMGAYESGYSRDDLYERMKADPRISGGLRSCIRVPLLDWLGKLLSGYSTWIAGTGNECEDRWVFYFQKRGDGAIDRSVISMHSKTEVFQLAWHLGEHFPAAREIYRELIMVKPSADLWGENSGQSDEDELEKELGVKLTYGRVNPENGEVIEAGTIERVSRFADDSPLLFNHIELLPGQIEHILDSACEHPAFAGMQEAKIRELVWVAYRRYRNQASKENYSQRPFLERDDLLANAVTNELPLVV